MPNTLNEDKAERCFKYLEKNCERAEIIREKLILSGDKGLSVLSEEEKLFISGFAQVSNELYQLVFDEYAEPGQEFIPPFNQEHQRQS